MIKFSLKVSILILLCSHSCTQPNIPDEASQIAMAIQTAPETDRDGAAIFGYDAKGSLVLLREGTNNLICLSDDPNREGFQTVCYHNELEPFMVRGRELRAEGQSFQQIFDTREAEAKAGTLQMPKDGATLHLLEGPEGKFNEQTGKVENAFYRYVVYIPWATAESTGLPLQPLVPGGPWIMDPGTHRAHIMITPPRETQQPDKE